MGGCIITMLDYQNLSWKWICSLFSFSFIAQRRGVCLNHFLYSEKKKRIFWLVGVYGHINNSINSTQSYCFSFLYLKKKKTKLARKKSVVDCFVSIFHFSPWSLERPMNLFLVQKMRGQKKKKTRECSPICSSDLVFFF